MSRLPSPSQRVCLWVAVVACAWSLALPSGLSEAGWWGGDDKAQSVQWGREELERLKRQREEILREKSTALSCSYDWLLDYVTGLLVLVYDMAGIRIFSGAVTDEQLTREYNALRAATHQDIRNAIESFVKRCCGKGASCEGCGDAFRPPADSSGRPPEIGSTGVAGPPHDVSRPSGEETRVRPSRAEGIRHAPAPPPDIDTRPQTTSASPLTGGQRPEPTPPPIGGRSAGSPPQRPTTEAAPPSSSDTAVKPPAVCCERCPGNYLDRLYFPIPPDTDCQPGDARRDDLSVTAGTCANPLAEKPGPSTYGDACCAGKPRQTLYDSAASGDANSEVGATLRSACGEDPCAASASGKPGEGPPSRLDVSILSTSKGPNGRNWVPENPTLKLGKDRLRPCAKAPLYVVKEAGTKSLAVAAMAALGVDEESARTAEASKGTSCQSGGHAAPARDTRKERAATAAAMSLLASQAKGQIEGLRATFDVTGREAQLRDASLEADVVNEVTQHKSRVSVPVRFETPQDGK